MLAKNLKVDGDGEKSHCEKAVMADVTC